MSEVGKTICIYSLKGGVGKTVLSLNLAGVCELNKKKALLLDFDLQSGCIGMIINEDINKTMYNLVEDVKCNKFNNVSDYIYKYSDFIDVLACPKDPRQSISSKYISIILDKVKSFYDIIIIDTCSKMDDVNLTILDKVDEILFVIDNDVFTLKNTRNIISIFNDCNISNYKVLLNASIDFKVPYFGIMDMKKIIGANIDYSISKDMFIKDISSYLYECKIPILVKGMTKKCKSDVNTLELVIRDLEECYEKKG